MRPRLKERSTESPGVEDLSMNAEEEMKFLSNPHKEFLFFSFVLLKLKEDLIWFKVVVNQWICGLQLHYLKSIFHHSCTLLSTLLNLTLTHRAGQWNRNQISQALYLKCLPFTFYFPTSWAQQFLIGSTEQLPLVCWPLIPQPSGFQINQEIRCSCREDPDQVKDLFL